MNDKQLLRKAMWNSGLLALMFANMTGAAFATGSYLTFAIGGIATAFTINDALKMHAASSAAEPTETPKEN